MKTTKKPLGYYHELRCDKMVTSGKLCERCIDRRIAEHNDTKKLGGNLTILWHGLVTEPITSDCIFGGPGFLENAKEYGISRENLQLGIGAHAAAVAGLNGVPPLPDMSAMVKEGITPVIVKKTKAKKGEPAVETAPKKSSKNKPVQNLAESAVFIALSQPTPITGEPAPVVVQAPSKAEVKPKPKKKISTAVAAPPPQPIAILSEEKPVDVDNVEIIDVIVKHINGTDYYYDSRNHKNKLYNPKNGLCVGLWDDKNNVIVPHDDSDVE